MSDQKKRTACVVGATGLIGSHVLDLLLGDETYETVKVFSRSALSKKHSKLEVHKIDFDKLTAHTGAIGGDDVFWCLGTTIKAAGTREKFWKIDFSYTVEFAHLALKQGIQQFLVVTALGANAQSRLFYNRVKGEIEQTLQQIPFKKLRIFRPSLLLGNRKEPRLVEKMGAGLARFLKPLFVGITKRYAPIEAKSVAAAMIRIAKSNNYLEQSVFESEQISRLNQINI